MAVPYDSLLFSMVTTRARCRETQRGIQNGLSIDWTAFTVIDQNRDGIISKDDLRDTFAAMGSLNVKNEELEAMVKEANGPINFTVFLTMFGEKLKGADPEDVIIAAFKVLDPEGKGTIKKEFLQELLTTQCDRFSAEEMKNFFTAFPPDVAGNVDYKNVCYVITHGEEKDQE
ncbi:MLRS protein, partial [Polypterus senegalus]